MRLKHDPRLRIGVLIGLGLAVLCAAWRGAVPVGADLAMPTHGAVLSDCTGSLRTLVIHYVPEAHELVGTAYAQFLSALPADVTVQVVCPDEKAFEVFRESMGKLSCRLVAVPVGHTMTCWSRDRWLALEPAAQGPTLLLAPREEAGADVWPRRAGDARVAGDLAAASDGAVEMHRSCLAFDGGDFVADSETVFVTPAVARRNVGAWVASEQQLQRDLSEMLHRRVVLLTQAPPHHAGMFMMTVGNRTVLVGDPSLAREHAEGLPLAGPDFSDETQRLFDAVAEHCAGAGYRVVRIPTVPDRDGRTWLTWLNVIIDERDGRRTVYMPTFTGVEALSDAAESVWRELGYEVRRIDCTATYRYFGSLRCLVNVLRRRE
jgi:hypothetical protein